MDGTLLLKAQPLDFLQDDIRPGHDEAAHVAHGRVEIGIGKWLPRILANSGIDERGDAIQQGFPPAVHNSRSGTRFELLQEQRAKVGNHQRPTHHLVLLGPCQDRHVGIQECVVLVPNDQSMRCGAALAMQVEIVHAGMSEDTVVLGKKALDRHMRHELSQVEMPLDIRAPREVIGRIHRPKQVGNGRVERGVGVQLVSARFEQALVGRKVVP